MDTDRNLLFGVLALQADLIDAARFAEACSCWASRKERSLAELLVERGWITPEDRADVERLMERKLRKHAGDPQASLAAVADAEVRRLLAVFDDPDIRQTISDLTQHGGHVLFSTVDHARETRDRYTLTSLHATGGIGRVWLARDTQIGREVALKDLRPERADHPAVWARFLEEARITGQLEHPGIVPVYEISRPEEGQTPFYTMRLVRGRTLVEAIRAHHAREATARDRDERLGLNDLLNAFVMVCNAVAYAHSRGVIHRDLKGQNVVLGDFGEVIVLDWGLAKLVGHAESTRSGAPIAPGEGHSETLAGQVMGTPAYMAPEQAEGRADRIDARTDIYGLGAILYETLAGRPPFGGADTAEVLRKVREQPPEPPRTLRPEVSPALEAVCLKALAKDPSDRYPSASELAREVRRWLADEPVRAYPEPFAARAGRWARRHKPAVAGAAALLVTAVVSLALGLAAVSWEQRRTDAARSQALRNYLASERQRGRADANLGVARDAVDRYFVRISTDRLLKQPGLQPLRRELLQSAADYYRTLAEGQADDPATEADAGMALNHLAQITAQIGSPAEALPLVERAVSRLEALDRSHPEEPDHRSALAASYFTRGRLRETLGQDDEAGEDFHRALTLREEWIAAHPDDLDRREQLAATLDALAGLAHRNGRLDEARDRYREALDRREALARQRPDEPRYRWLLGASLYNIARLDRDAGRLDEARSGFERAIALRDRLAEQYPDDLDYRRDLVFSHGEFGGFQQFQLGQPREAEASYRAALETARGLVRENPKVTAYRRDVAVLLNNLAGLLRSSGQDAEALDLLGEAVASWRAMAEADPEVIEYRANLGDALGVLGQTLTSLGRDEPAGEALRESISIFEGLCRDHAEVVEFPLKLGTVVLELGRLESSALRHEEALSAFDRSVGRVSEVLKSQPEHASARDTLALALWGRADTASRLGRHAEALADLGRAIALQDEDRPIVAALRLCRALALARSGDAEAATAEADGIDVEALERSGILRPGSTQHDLGLLYALCAPAVAEDSGSHGAGEDRADRYASRAVECLRRAASAGCYKTPLDVERRLARERDLDPLRPREDFRALLADLSAEAPG